MRKWMGLGLVCSFACNVQAQWYACPGQDVVLKLDSVPRVPVTQWQVSSDLGSWTDLVGSSGPDSFIFKAPSAGTYYYRAVSQEEDCQPYYSQPGALISGSPPAPKALTGSEITRTAFLANWEDVPVQGVKKYYLDVARTRSFADLLTGYNNKELSDTTSHMITGLSCNTPYYFKVRVLVDSCGTSSDSEIKMVKTDSCAVPAQCTYTSTCAGDLIDARNGKTYKNVQIAKQCWMAQNLDIGSYVPGSSIMGPGQDNQNASIEKYCYGDNQANCGTFGGLYSWQEAMAYANSVSVAPGPRGICPAGWHLPTDNEWTCLVGNLGGINTAGGNLKDTLVWSAPNTGATNSSGFTGLPAGQRTATAFGNINTYGYFWTSTEKDAQLAYYHYLMSTYALGFNATSNKYTGGSFSVRCVKD